ncbi:putative protease Do-like 14 [Durio zibethinus]|uniref:Protease Do-like 14 n=1 Tax=Durio zibethinus TaxID=66656 RepID=A0A6P5WU87_DURZI|nr:putative protease Do-like 14 [Durio zibethinus]
MEKCDESDCQGLRKADCGMSSEGYIDGPIINCQGEIIGINFYHWNYTSFLPMNIAFRCLKCLKKQNKVHHPCLGMKFTDLYSVELDTLEIIIQQYFPHISYDVMIEQIAAESPAARAGIVPNDVIVELGSNIVRSSMEYFGTIWDKTGESVETVVMRACLGEANFSYP